MLTFSVNKDSERMYSEEMVKFLEKVYQGGYTPESIGVIAEKILDDRADDIEDISSYSKEIHRLQELKRTIVEEDYILAVYELAQGYRGCLSESVGFITEEYEDLYKDSIVEDFLLMRERIYYSEGKDIYRLLELSLMDDKRSIKDLQKLCKIYKALSELIQEVVTQRVFEQIHTILA